MASQMSPMQVAVRLRKLGRRLEEYMPDDDYIRSLRDELDALTDELVPDGDTPDAVGGGAVEGEGEGRGDSPSPSLPDYYREGRGGEPHG